MTFHLRKPSSFTAADGAAGPASENTSTNRLPALAGAAPMGAAERIPRRSADGDGVDWKTKETCICITVVTPCMKAAKSNPTIQFLFE